MIPLVTAQAVAFWVLGPLSVIAGIGMVVNRKPVHSALCLAGLMVCLAGLYASLDAPFLFVAQIIVYTGAVMMLFVFTMMVIGIDTVDEMIETIKGQRVAAIIGVVGLLALLVLAVGHGIVASPAGLEQATGADGNVRSLAYLIFSDYVFPFEATAALLITAALAAMVLAHGEPLFKKEQQKERINRRTKEFGEKGTQPGPLPNPGVYARHNSVDYPSLLPDGSISDDSIIPTLAERGIVVVDKNRLLTPTKSANKAIVDVRDDQKGIVPGDDELAAEPTDENGLKEVNR